MTGFDSTPLLRVLFACRGSTRDGLGHVMRSRTVARRMALRSSVRMVVIGDSYVESLLAGRDLNYEVHAEEQALLSACERFQPQEMEKIQSLPSGIIGEIKIRSYR